MAEPHTDAYLEAAIREAKKGLRYNHGGPFGAVIVHGHSVSDAPEFRPNRIGIDTGAYRSGKLTALGLEGSARWILST